MAWLDTVTNFIPPLKTATELAKVALGKQNMQQANTNIGKSLLVTGVTGVGLIATAKAPQQAKTTIGKAVATTLTGGASLIGIGAASKSTAQEAAKITGSAISGSYNVGSNIVGYSRAPSIDAAKKIFNENPFLVSAIGAVGAAAVGKAAIPAVTSLLQTGAIKEQTGAYQQYTAGLEAAAAGLKETTPKAAASAVEYFNLPQTQTGVPSGTSYAIVPDVTPTAKKVVRRKTAKPKKLNTTPINIKNYNILALNSKRYQHG